MSFCSNIFIFVFLPFVCAIYFIIPLRARNLWLLVASTVFYLYGEASYVWILLTLTVSNYVAGLLMKRTAFGKWILIIAICANLSFLLYYKYFTFLINTVLSDVTGFLGVGLLFSASPIVLPIGISFFTFHGVSYAIDIWRGKVAPCRSLTDFGMYFTLFAHLIAGPIVRYSEVEHQIKSRIINCEGLSQGILRFSIGLGKKVIIADPLAAITNHVFSLPYDQVGTLEAWLAILAYAFQIYFDFSGYTDMGIGLAKLFGIDFPENFNQPYRSHNVTEFWRRWHMTLSRWFRDYLYIPLGGNRQGVTRTCANLLIVFFLCGLWHGASYTFILWGLYYGLLLCIERILDEFFGFKPRGVLAVIFTFFLVTMGWVLFRSPSIEAAVAFFKLMFWPVGGTTYYSLGFYLTNDKIFSFVAAIIFSFVPIEWIEQKLSFLRQNEENLLKVAAAIPIMIYSVLLVSMNGFKPFIYFQF